MDGRGDFQRGSFEGAVLARLEAIQASQVETKDTLKKLGEALELKADERDLRDLEEDVKRIRDFQVRAAGAMSVGLLALQVFGQPLTDYIFKR